MLNTMSLDKENQINRNVVLDFSPQKLPMKKTNKKLSEFVSESELVPTLLCAPFQSTLWLGFGCVSLNILTKKIFILKNETTKNSIISVEKWNKTSAAKNGFSIILGAENSPHHIVIKPGEAITATVTWLPDIDQTISETILLKLNDKLSLQLSLHGIAGSGDVIKSY